MPKRWLQWIIKLGDEKNIFRFWQIMLALTLIKFMYKLRIIDDGMRDILKRMMKAEIAYAKHQKNIQVQ